MKLWRKVLEISWADRRLLISSLVLIAIMRLALSVLPFRTLWRLLRKFTVRHLVRRVAKANCRPGIPINRLTWSVQKTSCYVPQATCLTQATAAYLLLWQHGYPADIRIGVGKNENGEFEAHAWVESGGQVVIGGTGPAGADVTHWTPLPALDRCKC